MFESHGHIHVHVYSPGRRRQPTGVKLIFKNINFKSSVNLDICCNLFFLLTDFVAVFPIQTHRKTCRKICQGQPRVIIYTHFASRAGVPRCCVPSFRIIGLLVLDIQGVAAVWSCDINRFINRFPLPMEAPHKPWH